VSALLTGMRLEQWLTSSIGAFGFGFAVDIIGRKWAFNLTCLITSVFGLLIVGHRYLVRIHELILRPPLDTITKQSVVYTSCPVSVLEETSPSTPSLLSNSCPRTDETWSRYSPCGNLSEWSPHPVSLTVLSPNTDVIPISLDAGTRY
jgi:hypothetical protein